MKFGTGGWRAIIGDEFIKDNIQLLALAVAKKMQYEKKTEKGIVIGYDRRFLSKEAMRWAAVVFAAEGIETYLINEASPTPLIMYYIKKHELPYGMMITASHNPALYNGIKVFTKEGRDASKEVTDDIERYLAEITAVKEVDYQAAVDAGSIHEIYPLNEYIDHIMGQVDMDAIRKSNLKVAVDPLYGVSGRAINTLLYTARCRVEMHHNEHDTLFAGRMPAPNKETLRPLADQVQAYSFDIGIATDGDGDRLGVIDDTGRFLHPNDVMVLLYYYMNEYKGVHGPVVRNIATTHLLDRIAEKYEQKCYEVPVGFKYVSSKMSEVNAILGGESSGGLTVPGHIHGKDGIFAAMLIIEMIAVSGRKISELFDEIKEKFGSTYLEEREYSFSQEKKHKIMELLFQEKKVPDMPYELKKVSYEDGLKLYFVNGGWVSVRFSGTEPLLRVFCEMENGEDAREICREIEHFLEL